MFLFLKIKSLFFSVNPGCEITRSFYKNKLYKNIDPEKPPKIRNILRGCLYGGQLARLHGLVPLAEMIFVPRSYEFSIPPDRAEIIVYK